MTREFLLSIWITLWVYEEFHKQNLKLARSKSSLLILFFHHFADTVFLRKLTPPPTHSSHNINKKPRPLVQTYATILRTRRSDFYSDSEVVSSQFFSAENFSSFIDLDSTGEPVREISDQELTRLGFPVPTPAPDPILTHSRPTENFPIGDLPFFQIISRKYAYKKFIVKCFSEMVLPSYRVFFIPILLFFLKVIFKVEFLSIHFIFCQK